MPRVITSKSICLSGLVFLLGLALACGSDEVPVDSVAIPVIESISAPVLEPEVREVDIRTIGPEDLVRVRDQHAGLIASIPTPTPFPTRGVAESASVYVMTGDIPDSASEASLISDPSLGIWWYRTSGGDWTTRRMRQGNPYGPLFYSTEYLAEHPSFYAGGMQELIAQRFAQEAELLLPEIRGRGSSLIAPLATNLGWEIASLELPVVRVWSSFTYLGPLDDGPREYRVGGVLSMGVGDYLDRTSGNVIYQYLVMDHFLGNGVILEDAGPLVDREGR